MKNLSPIQLAYYVVAVGTYALSVWPPMAPIHDLLVGVAGSLIIIPHNAPKHAQKVKKEVAPKE